jgi:hypothetical protein
MKQTNLIILMLIILIIFNAFLYFDLKQLKCDMVASVYAERQYTYPILRELGYEPDSYGKDTQNPLTTSDKYAFRCK